MARVPAADRPRISQWLIEARGQTSARRFILEMRTATGWAPNLANYAQWESGAVTPKEGNLGRVIDYHRTRGVAGPDFTPPAPALSAEDRLLAALAPAGSRARRRGGAGAVAHRCRPADTSLMPGAG